jgi:hypothetical protein
MQNVSNYLPGSEKQSFVCNLAQSIISGKFNNSDLLEDFMISELGSNSNNFLAKLPKYISSLTVFVIEGACYN